MNYVLGFDGGGTKTALLALALDGQNLAAIEGAASNPKAVTFEKAAANLTNLIDQFFEVTAFKPEDCRGMCFGIAGIATEEEAVSMTKQIANYIDARYGLSLPISVRNDAEIALMAGLGQNSGMIAIAGTGAIVFGFTPDRKRFRAGGWGHILGDNGSGYDIGLRTLQAVMLAYDDVMPPTTLTELVLAKHGFASPEDLRVYIYQPFIKKQHIADYAELCIQAAEQGDSTAIAIVRNAAAELADLALALRSKDDWFKQSPIAVTGSIFKYSELFMDAFRERLQTKWNNPRVIRSEHAPAYGAAMLVISELERG